MGLPSKRLSKSRGRIRRAHDALVKVGLINCPKCQKLTVSHRVCQSCGTYKGKEVVKILSKKTAPKTRKNPK